MGPRERGSEGGFEMSHHCKKSSVKHRKSTIQNQKSRKKKKALPDGEKKGRRKGNPRGGRSASGSPREGENAKRKNGARFQKKNKLLSLG